MKEKFSSLFLWTAILLTVCLVASNLFATKVVSILGVTLPGAVIIFPISYILNDCISEVWGYRRARLVIWIAFAMNLFVVVAGQILVWMPPAPFWDASEHFDYVFNTVPRVIGASLLAFLAGSHVNAIVLSKMKVSGEGRHFGLRAIVSSVAGEALDSAIFMPIAFWGTEASALMVMMLSQVTFKVLYEIVILPVTTVTVRKMKKMEGTDVFDRGISYNPFNVKDI